jgi:hypothetical protein
MGPAKSYAERLFDFPSIGPLVDADARAAISQPVHEEGAEITDPALQSIVANTHGYPYFLQEWGKHAWDTADASPISDDDAGSVPNRHRSARRELFSAYASIRLTPLERRYCARAELGAGPHRSRASPTSSTEA